VKSWGGEFGVCFWEVTRVWRVIEGGGEGHDSFSFSNILNPLIKIFIIEHENFEL
jgi:hypothetical protein